MSDIFDRTVRKMKYEAKDKNEHEIWRNNVREKIREVSGLGLMEECNLEPKVLESVQLDGYRRDKIIIQTEPDIWMPIFCLVPNNTKSGRKNPAFIVPHAHGSNKYLTAGATDIPLVKEIYEKHSPGKPFFAIELVREGYIVF